MATCKVCGANVGCSCRLSDGMCAACKAAADKKLTSPKPVVKNVKS